MIHIVMPIGVSQPGTPVLSLLEKSIDSILNQSFKHYIFTVAADENVSTECKKLLEKKGVDVMWFPTASFFRRGGIWKKITEAWKTTSTKYLAFIHYDDLWDSSKLKKQLMFMESESLNSSWSELYLIDDNHNVNPNDYARFEQFDVDNVGLRTPAMAHSMIVKRTSFFDSGIMEFENTWSPVWEDLFVLYMNKQGKGKKSHGAKMMWRNHRMNMSNSIFIDPLLKDVLAEQKTIGEYSNEECEQDSLVLHQHMLKLTKEIKHKYEIK